MGIEVSMPNMNTLNKKKIIGFTLVITSIILAIFLSFRTNRIYIENNQLIEHTYKVTLEIEMIYASLIEAETSVRGYVISKNPSFLQSYISIEEQIDLQMNTLRALISGEQFQIRNYDSLKGIVAKELASMNNIVSLAHSMNPRLVQAYITTKGAKDVKTTVRTFMTLMKEKEYALLRKHMDEHEAGLSATVTALISVILFIFFLLASMIFNALKNISNQKKTETSLHNVNSELDDLYHNSPCGYHSLTMDGIIFKINTTELQWLGYTEDEVINKMYFTQLLSPTSAKKFDDEFLVFKQRGWMHDIEFEMLRKDGRAFWVLLNSTAIKDHTGSIVHMRSTVADITEMKQLATEMERYRTHLEQIVHDRSRELRERAEQYSILFERNPMPMWVYDLQSLQFIAVNDSAIARYGYSRSEFLSMTIKEIRPNEEVPSLLNHLSHAAGGLENGTWRHQKKDGSIITVEITSHAVQFNKNAARLVLSNDITERLKAEQLVREAEQRYRSTLDSMQEGCQIIGFDFRYLYVNNVVAAQGRTTKDALIGCTMMEKYPGIENTSMFQKIRLCMDERIPFRLENEFNFTDGSVGWFDLNIEPVPEGVFIISADITQQKNVEEELLNYREHLEDLVQKRTSQLELVNRELESFSYSVSHDLRAPLRYINGFVDLLIKQYGSSLDEKGKHYLAVINQSSAQMGELIDDLLIFSRMGKAAISVTQVDMRAIVDEVIMNFNAEINSRSIVWTIENLPTVNADQSMMKLVFQNLIGNAIKYSRPKKEAIITIQHKKTDTEHTFSVSDNGVGFDMQYYEKLFGVFQRLHRNEEFEGTGIGLANVQRIISRHGGKVWAKSQPDKETSFYFTLPHIIVKENQ